MCGFATPSSFAKSFKNHFKMSASEWRDRSNTFFDKASTPIQIDCGQVSLQKSSPMWTFSVKDSIRQVVIEDISPFKVAYIRNVGPYEGDDILFDSLYTQLCQWAMPRGYMDDTTFPLNIYYDNPEITENQKLRVMVAIPVEDDVKPSGSIGVTKIAGGKYGVCRFRLKKDEFGDAWEWLFSTWLTQSGYARDSREAFERCRGEKLIDGERLYNVDICVPVKAGM
jgi:AraC family transcriptional regulator